MNNNYTQNSVPKKSRKWLKITLIVLAVLFVAGGLAAWKTGYILNKVSVRGGLFNSLVHAIPGVEDKLKGEDEDRINIALLGMRGENVPGGGLLADTIMVASIKPVENKVSLISVPRDLYVTDPGTSSQSKINAVYAYGEEKGKGQGIEDMEKVLSEISGLDISYAVVINFQGFKDLVNILGGVDVTLDKAFTEGVQFNEPHVCDGDKGGVFTIPTGKYEYKKNERGKIVAQYPLCTNNSPECGGNFELPAGKSTLNGDKALCFVRSRYQSSDFERAKRQQMVLQSFKEKAFQLGFTDFQKINSIVDTLGDNVRTDLQAWEMKRLFDFYQKMNNPQMYQRVLENSEEGLLYNPPQTPEAGYILLPRGDNYDKIKNLFQNVFTMPSQSDIKPK